MLALASARPLTSRRIKAHWPHSLQASLLAAASGGSGGGATAAGSEDVTPLQMMPYTEQFRAGPDSEGESDLSEEEDGFYDTNEHNEMQERWERWVLAQRVLAPRARGSESSWAGAAALIWRAGACCGSREGPCQCQGAMHTALPLPHPKGTTTCVTSWTKPCPCGAWCNG